MSQGITRRDIDKTQAELFSQSNIQIYLHCNEDVTYAISVRNVSFWFQL